MKVKTVKDIIVILLTILCVLSVIVCRIETFDLTEGQAFVEGYFYWVSATVCAVLALIIGLIPTKRSYYDKK